MSERGVELLCVCVVVVVGGGGAQDLAVMSSACGRLTLAMCPSHLSRSISPQACPTQALSGDVGQTRLTRWEGKFCIFVPIPERRVIANLERKEKEDRHSRAKSRQHAGRLASRQVAQAVPTAVAPTPVMRKFIQFIHTGMSSLRMKSLLVQGNRLCPHLVFGVAGCTFGHLGAAHRRWSTYQCVVYAFGEHAWPKYCLDD